MPIKFVSKIGMFVNVVQIGSYFLCLGDQMQFPDSIAKYNIPHTGLPICRAFLTLQSPCVDAYTLPRLIS